MKYKTTAKELKKGYYKIEAPCPQEDNIMQTLYHILEAIDGEMIIAGYRWKIIPYKIAQRLKMMLLKFI